MESLPDKQQIISDLLSMGFSQELCEQAYEKSEIKALESIILTIEQIQNNEKSNPDPKLQEESKTTENSQPISSMVNQEFSKELQEMGFSKNVSEKSLFFTQNLSVQKALDWITENSKAPDFEEELRMVSQEESASKLSKEEAAEKARELQRKLREKRLLKEKEEEEEREKNRVKGGKAMTQAKRELDEMQAKRDMEAKLREKKEDELAKQKVLMQLERDRQERFGNKKSTNVEKNVEIKKEPTPVEKIQLAAKSLKTAHPNNLFPGAAATAFDTIRLYLQNILKNPAEEKFRKINLGNENFMKRVGNLFGGITILKDCGFVENNGFLLMEKVDESLLKAAINILMN